MASRALCATKMVGQMATSLSQNLECGATCPLPKIVLPSATAAYLIRDPTWLSVSFWGKSKDDCTVLGHYNWLQ